MDKRRATRNAGYIRFALALATLGTTVTGAATEPEPPPNDPVSRAHGAYAQAICADLIAVADRHKLVSYQFDMRTPRGIPVSCSMSESKTAPGVEAEKPDEP